MISAVSVRSDVIGPSRSVLIALELVASAAGQALARRKVGPRLCESAPQHNSVIHLGLLLLLTIN